MMMAYPPPDGTSGMAIFSTRNGTYAPRQAAAGMSIVIRSDPAEDRDTMTAKLQAEFPAVCKAITTPTPRVGDYFDGYDQELHGFEFLRAVLLHIVTINTDHARRAQDYVGRWIATNSEAFAMLTPEHMLEHLFTEEDINEYGKDFLGEATVRIKHIKEQAIRNDFTRESERLREQHAYMADKNREFVHSHTLAYGPPPSSLPATQNVRATSNPERHQGHLPQYSVHAIPPVRHSSQQGLWPQHHLSPSTGALGHAHTGSASRVDPLAHPAPPTTGNYFSPTMGYSMHYPDRSFPVPSGYGPQMRTPIADRHQSFSNYYPKGRKNPVKRSSDDARRSSFDVECRSRSLSRRRSSNLGAFELVQSPKSKIPSTRLPNDSSQHLSTSHTSTDMPVFGSQQQRNTPGSEKPAMRNAAVPFPRNDERRYSTSLHATQYDRYATYPHPGQPGEMTPQRGLSNRLIDSPDHTALGQPVSATDTSGLSILSHATVSTGPSIDPHLASPNISNVRAAFSNVRSTTSEVDTLQHPLPDRGQSRFQRTTQRPQTQESPGKMMNHLPDPKIWIGGIPPELSKETVKKMLEPCRGLLAITYPRMGVYGNLNYTYVFASFRSQHDAEEALDRIPQTRFADLPEGRFLNANWPRKDGSTPGRYHEENKVLTGRDTPQTSPTKARKVDGAEGHRTHEAGEEAMHSWRKSGELPSKKAALSITKSGNHVPDTHTTEVTHASRGSVHPRLDPIKEAHSLISVIQKNELIQAMPDLSAAKPVSEDTGIEGTEIVPSSPLANAEDSSRAHSIMAGSSLSAVDFNSGQATTYANVLGRVQKAQRPNTRARDDHAALSTQAKKGNKKKNNKSNRAKPPDALGKGDGSQPSRGVPNSENIRPPSTSQTKPAEKAILEKAALPKHEDDAAEAQGAETQVQEPSAVISSIRAIKNSESSIVGNTSEVSMESLSIEPSQLFPAKASDHLEPIMGQQVSDLMPSATMNTSVKAAESGAVASALVLAKGEEHKSQALSREPSSSSLNGEDSASFEQCSTVPTSYWQTERSNSIDDVTRLDSIPTTMPIPEQQQPKREVDAKVLRTLLQADAAEQEKIQSLDSTELHQPSVQGERSSTSAQELKSIHQDSKNGSGASTELAINSADDTSSTALRNANLESDPAKAASLTSPAQNPEPSALLTLPQALSSSPNNLQSRSLDNKPEPLIPPRSGSLQSVSTPIQTRRKKKSKQFTPLEEVNHSKTRAQPNKQSIQPGVPLDGKADLAATRGPKTPPVAQAKTSKQKQNPKPKSQKNKKPPGLAIEPSLRTPSPDRSTTLPRPETPFQIDDGLGLPVAKPKHTCHEEIFDMSSGQKVTAPAEYQKQQDYAWRMANSQPDTAFLDTSHSDSLSSDSVVIMTPTRSSVQGEEGLETALVKAGYYLPGKPTATSYFIIKDPCMVRLEMISSFVDIQDRFEGLKKLREERKVVEGVLVAQERRAGPSPRTPRGKSSGRPKMVEDMSSIVVLEGQIEEIATYMISVKAARGERNIGNSFEDRTIETAKNLLELSPRRGPTNVNAGEWSRMATRYIGENASERTSRPSTPTRKPRGGKAHHSMSSPGISLREENRLIRATPAVSDRPGSTIITRPGSATAIVKLGRGEDISKVTGAFSADPNAFFGYGRTVKRKQEDEASSGPEQISTPTSPQTVGHGTPPKERRKRIPSSPSARQSRRSAMNLTNTFADMRAKAPSALDHACTDEPNAMETGKKVPAESDGASSELLKNNVVGNWGQNSGAKYFEERYEVPGRNLNGHASYESDRKRLEKDVDAFLNTLLESSEPKDQKHPSSTVTKEEGVQVVSSKQPCIVITDKDSSKPFERQKAVEYADSCTQTDNQTSYYMRSRMVMDVPGQHIARPAEQGTGILKISPEISTEARLDANITTPSTFLSRSEASSFTQDDQDDLDYPVLSRGSTRSVKGGKSTSPTRGRYAAVAATKAKALLKKEKQQEAKEQEKTTNHDQWAVAAEEQWGFGRSGRKKRQQTF